MSFKEFDMSEYYNVLEEVKKDYELFKMDYGDYCWYSMVQLYLVYPKWIEKVDKKYGAGASKIYRRSLKILL